MLKRIFKCASTADEMICEAQAARHHCHNCHSQSSISRAWALVSLFPDREVDDVLDEVASRSGSALGRSESRTALETGFHHACQECRGTPKGATWSCSAKVGRLTSRTTRSTLPSQPWPPRRRGPWTSDLGPKGPRHRPTFRNTTADEDSVLHLLRKDRFCLELCGCPDSALATLSGARLYFFQEQALLCEVSWLPSGHWGLQPSG